MDKRFTTETFHSIDVYDLNALIAETYGFDEFEGNLEAPNDSVHSFKVEKLENRHPSLEGFQQKALAEILDDKSCEIYLIHNVLDDMADKGIIEEGNYLVEVSW